MDLRLNNYQKSSPCYTNLYVFGSDLKEYPSYKANGDLYYTVKKQCISKWGLCQLNQLQAWKS